MAALKKEIFKDKITTRKRDLIENIIQAWHNTHALQEIAKNALPHKMGLLERENSLNIEIVLS